MAENNEEKQDIQNNLDENTPELSNFEELDKNYSVVKKYIIYVSKDFVPIIDRMSTDERSAYINDAIQKKVDLEDARKQRARKIKLRIHFVIAALVIIFITPFALLAVNKAIMATFENYKYSQDNFEKLYKHRFEKDKAFIRSLQYNKEQEKKKETSSVKKKKL